MKKNIYWSIVLLVAIFLCQSCQKNNADPLAVIPGDTTVTFLPSSISFTSVDLPADNVVVSFMYSADNRTIKVYSDDPATASPFDKLGLIFYYTSTGYLEKREDYDTDGKIIQTFVVERDNANALQRVLVARDTDPLADTFHFSFRDSATNYVIMNVNNTYRNYEGAFDVSEDFTFFNDQLIRKKAGYFSNGAGSVYLGEFTQSYDGSDKLLSSKYDGGYETDYSYETPGIGLDSFYHFLGGKDGRYLSTSNEWATDAYEEFYFYPLYLVLNDPSEPEVQMHRYGVVKSVRSLPANVTFNFQNTFDNKERITETKILKNGVLSATWKVNY